jgi:methionyl-tRNA formyltransferase
MRLVFLGTPAFAVPTLERILAAGHEVLAVYTQPDRPKGRGGALAASPVKIAADSRSLPVHQPERIKRPEPLAHLGSLRPDAMVVVGYGQIIPQSIIDIPPLGIINVHASLLPKYRGAAPVQWALARGESVSGVTTMRIDAGLDTGDILLMHETPISPCENAIDLGARLAILGADLLVETLDALNAGAIVPRKQDHSQATLAPILRKEDGVINWNQPASEIYNRVRGFVPWPGAFTRFRGEGLHVWRAAEAESNSSGSPGSISVQERRVLVACGAGTSLELLEVQLEGRKRVAVEAFINGQRLVHNEVLGDMT